MGFYSGKNTGGACSDLNTREIDLLAAERSDNRSG
jgi:hypothetical protein